MNKEKVYKFDSEKQDSAKTASFLLLHRAQVAAESNNKIDKISPFVYNDSDYQLYITEEGKDKMAEKEKKPNRLWAVIKNTIPIKGLLFLAVVIAVLTVSLKTGFGTTHFNKNNTIKMGFEDIGELATQSAYCRQINVTSDVRTLFGMDIPFTQSKYVYSYDVIIKAGFNFAEIEPIIDEDSKTITLKMPAVKILSSEIKDDSLEIYLEKESIFTPITLTENNEARIELKKKAAEEAKENGLYDDAEKNAEELLKGFISKQFDLDTYKLKFEHTEPADQQATTSAEQGEDNAEE